MKTLQSPIHNINRYSHGFGGFGAMEQCNDGKYMLANEAINTYEELEDKCDNAIASRNYTSQICSEYWEQITELTKREVELKSRFTGMGVLFIVSLVVNGVLALKLLI